MGLFRSFRVAHTASKIKLPNQVYGLSPASQGQNLALNFLQVQCSLDSGSENRAQDREYLSLSGMRQTRGEVLTHVMYSEMGFNSQLP